jgi:membrane protease YdiL (CAAX protease family)/preprotein translocase subunit SecG
MIAAKIMRFRLGDLLPLHKVKVDFFVPLVMVGLGVSMLGNYATGYISGIFSIFGINPAQQNIDNPTGVWGLMLVILGSAFVPALVEEFAMRGVVLGSLRRFGDGFAIFVSAALFGLMHGNLVQAPFAFVVGLGLGYITVVSGSMWPSIIVHFLNNFLATVLNEFMTDMAPSLSTLANIMYAILMLSVGVIGAVLLIRRKPESFRLSIAKSYFSAKGRVGIFSATPLMIITFAFFAITMILVQFMY